VASATVDTGVQPTGEWRRTVAYVAFGVGGASVIVGGVAGALAIVKHGQLSDACPIPTECKSDQRANLDSYHRLGTIADVGFIVGGVALAAGVVLLVTQPKDSSATATKVTPYLGLGSAGVTGVF
jgi:hypothetical protein